MKLGQNASLGNCSDEFDGSGERSRAILALLLIIFCKLKMLIQIITNISFNLHTDVETRKKKFIVQEPELYIV
jgi:uncharacterized protein YeeX (DUF496 family)